MRRSDREIVDSGKMDEIISRCHCCRLGFYDGEEVYIVPLNFGFCRQERNRHFYFHSAKEGRKIELITKAPKVSFELDTGYALQPGGDRLPAFRPLSKRNGCGARIPGGGRSGKRGCATAYHAAQHGQGRLGLFTSHVGLCMRVPVRSGENLLQGACK